MKRASKARGFQRKRLSLALLQTVERSIISVLFSNASNNQRHRLAYRKSRRTKDPTFEHLTKYRTPNQQEASDEVQLYVLPATNLLVTVW